MPDGDDTHGVPDEERLGELLAMLPPAPPAWVAAAKSIPGTQRDLAAPGDRLEQDGLLRDATRDIDTTPDPASRDRRDDGGAPA